MEHSETLGELMKAFAAAQAEIENPTKNAENPHFRSRFADLPGILNTIRPTLAKHALAVVQFPGWDDGVVTVETILSHASGEWMGHTAGAPAQKMDPQGVGSAITYLRRYALAAVLGIAQEDDDGESAVHRPSRQSNQNGGSPADKPMPFGKTKGVRLGDHSEDQLVRTLDWCRQKDEEKFADLIRDIEAVLGNGVGV